MDSLPVTPQQTLTHELRRVINQRNVLSAKSKAKVLVALDQQIEENHRRQKLDLRSKVIEEILSSEVSYLRQLELIIKFFKVPLESSELACSGTRRALFGNIEPIYQVNTELATQLKVQGTNFGATFLNLAPYFKLYSMYAYNYKSGLSLLEELSRGDSKLAVWIRQQERRPEVNSRLSALLISPIQRLPRYRLLLRQLLSLTPVMHPHYNTLVAAVKEVEKATSHIESLVSDQEAHARLVTLQKCLVNCKPVIVAPNKRLHKEGVLLKMSANGQRAQRRYFILLSDSILYCKLVGRERDSDKPISEPGSLHCCCVLPISKCSVKCVLGQGVFNLSCRSETYILFSEHRDDAMDWVDAISRAVSEYKDNLKTLKKKSSSRYPLHLNRKRKLCHKENERNLEDESRPIKKVKLEQRDFEAKENGTSGSRKELGRTHPLQGEVPWTQYIQSIKSMFRTFGDGVRKYLYPGPSSR